MRNFTKQFTVIITVILISLTVKSQNYRTSVNARVGLGSYGISVKHFFNPVSTVDGLVHIDANLKRYMLTGLYEEHYQIGNINGLSWFPGLGLHGGFIKQDQVNPTINSTNTGEIKSEVESTSLQSKKDPVFGVDLIAGIDYKFPKMPVTIGVDIKPYTDFLNHKGIFWDGGIRIGYTF